MVVEVEGVEKVDLKGVEEREEVEDLVTVEEGGGLDEGMGTAAMAVVEVGGENQEGEIVEKVEKVVETVVEKEGVGKEEGMEVEKVEEERAGVMEEGTEVVVVRVQRSPSEK